VLATSVSPLSGRASAAVSTIRIDLGKNSFSRLPRWRAVNFTQSNAGADKILGPRFRFTVRGFALPFQILSIVQPARYQIATLTLIYCETSVTAEPRERPRLRCELVVPAVASPARCDKPRPFSSTLWGRGANGMSKVSGCPSSRSFFVAFLWLYLPMLSSTERVRRAVLVTALFAGASLVHAQQLPNIESLSESYVSCVQSASVRRLDDFGVSNLLEATERAFLDCQLEEDALYTTAVASAPGNTQAMALVRAALEQLKAKLKAELLAAPPTKE
jgi:hypothetical protein